MKLSDEMIKALIGMGLTRQQAQSTTAQALVDVLMPDEGRMLMAEAQRKFNDLSKKAVEIEMRIKRLEGLEKDIAEAKAKYGQVEDERAVQALALYGALIKVATGVNGVLASDAVKNAGYITYAYLGGQARNGADLQVDE